MFSQPARCSSPVLRNSTRTHPRHGGNLARPKHCPVHRAGHFYSLPDAFRRATSGVRLTRDARSGFGEGLKGTPANRAARLMVRRGGIRWANNGPRRHSSVPFFQSADHLFTDDADGYQTTVTPVPVVLGACAAINRLSSPAESRTPSLVSTKVNNPSHVRSPFPTEGNGLAFANLQKVVAA